MGVGRLSIVGTPDPCSGGFYSRLSFANRETGNTVVSVRLDHKSAAPYPVPQALRLRSLLHASVTVEYGACAYDYSCRTGTEPFSVSPTEGATVAYASCKTGTVPFVVSLTEGTTVERILRVIFDKHGMDKYV